MKKLLFISISILMILTNCGRYGYIKPKPQYTWPEMSSSLISGRVGIHIPDAELHRQFKHDKSQGCCKHKTIRVGSGVLKASNQAVKSVFSETVVLKSEPNDTYIKSLDLRGLLNFKEVFFNIEFMPYVDEEHGSEKISKYNIKLSLNINLTSIDFLLSDIRGFSVNVESSSVEPIPRNRINKELEDLTDELFELAADHLAKELVIIFGART